MRIFKAKAFKKWADSEGLSDDALVAAVHEMKQGLVDARLGGHVYKKRVALEGRGNRGGARTLLAFKLDERAFYLYGFAKNQRANVGEKELKAPPFAVYSAQLVVLGFELLAPLWLIPKRMRPAGLVCGAVIHVMTALLMSKLWLFSLYMLSFYSLFRPPREPDASTEPRAHQ